MKAKSNGNFIHVDSTGGFEKALKANSDVAYENTVFEAIVYPGSGRENEFVISLRSLKNGKLLSNKNSEIYASADNLSENEKFYLFYSFNNVIGMKFKLKNMQLYKL